MKKNEYFQNIRGICIILVIAIHLLRQNEQGNVNDFNIILRTIMNFCVGIFIFLSGYFVNIKKVENNKKGWIIKRLKRLGIPFLIFSALAATIALIENHNSISEYIIDIVLGRASAQLYYIVVLIQLVILTPFIIKIIQSKKKSLNIGVILITPVYLIVLAILNIKYHYQLPQYATIFLGWILYYYLGIYYKINKDNISLIKFKNKKCILVPVILINCCINIYMYKIGINYGYVISQVRLLNMLYILYVIVVILKFENRFKNINCLTKLGDLSFGIYFIHTYFIKIYHHTFNFNNYYIQLLIGIIFVIIFSYFSIAIFKKITKNKFDKILGF